MAACALTAPSHDETGDATYDVVVVGDSILAVDLASYDRPGWFADLADGRQPFYGNDGASSNWDAVDLGVALIAPGGCLVFQDNGLPLGDDEWARLLTHIVRVLPDDRCLVFVTTYSSQTGQFTLEPFPHMIAMSHTRIMVELIAAQPCHALVRWDIAVVADPLLVGPDGTHPSPAGSAWLLDGVLTALSASASCRPATPS